MVQRVTPSLVDYKLVDMGGVNTTFTGLDTVSDGDLMLNIQMVARYSDPAGQSMENEWDGAYGNGVDGEGPWFGYKNQATTAGDQTGWTDGGATGGTWSTTGFESVIQGVSYRWCDGSEDASTTIGNQGGNTSFGFEPRFQVIAIFQGADPTYPVWSPGGQVGSSSGTVLPATTADIDSTGGPGTATPAYGGLEFIVGGRQTGTSFLTFNTDVGYTSLYSFSDTADGDGYLRMQYKENTTGELDTFNATGAGNVRYRRFFVNGQPQADPQFATGDLAADAELTGEAQNITQQRKDAGRARDRRQQIWVSDIAGVRKVVLR